MTERTAAAGNIYDLGYRGYDGPRLGRRHAVRALTTYSLRGAFGIGRSGRAKVAPFGFALLTLLPSLIAVGVAALETQAGASGVIQSPIRYETYLGFAQTLLILFCAAQAPELVGRDQRYQVLPLYFSRALRRSDYAFAKLVALGVAILLVFLAPQAVLFAGQVLVAKDVVKAFFDNLSAIPPILATGCLAAALIASIGIAIGSSTPRRAYATAAIIAAFVIPPIIASIVTELSTGLLAQIVVLLDPTDLLGGANTWFFGHGTGNAVLRTAGLPGVIEVLAAVAWTAIAVFLTVRRYERIAA
jgi:ABC-2 type transport system permease protein